MTDFLRHLLADLVAAVVGVDTVSAAWSTNRGSPHELEGRHPKTIAAALAHSIEQEPALHKRTEYNYPNDASCYLASAQALHPTAYDFVSLW